MLFLVKVFLMQLLPFYRVEFPVAAFPQEFTYTEYKNGNQAGSLTLDEKDAAYASLRKMIWYERQGWRYDSVSYVPTQIFASPKLNINCLGNKLVVNFEDGDGRWTQISKQDIKASCPKMPG